ncbi:MAG: hypothetical protein LBO66_10715 [Deltaproteobacteria bacterium]|jgi:hypothetical protein|nr:hypothetical protein [Deltaproteobacteria bacterium]
MKSWLPFLVSELSEGAEPVLAQSLSGRDARAAVLDSSGKVLAGDFQGSSLFRGAQKVIGEMLPGKPLVAVAGDKRRFLLERQAGEVSLNFWKEALEGQEDAWASWLLTLAEPNGKSLKVTRHVLAAQGPWTTPRLPADSANWTLTPLNAGLGRLFVFGDDELALESAALGGRVGLKVTLVTIKPRDVEAESIQNVGSFKVISFPSWADLNADACALLGLRTGVYVLVTLEDNAPLMAEIAKVAVGWLGLAGAAAPPDAQPGLFPTALTPAQKALGLITEMLGN